MCVLPYRDGLEVNRTTYATAATNGLYVVTTSTTRTGFDEATNTAFVAPGDVEALAEGILAAPNRPRRPPRDPGRNGRRFAMRHVAAYEALE